MGYSVRMKMMPPNRFSSPPRFLIIILLAMATLLACPRYVIAQPEMDRNTAPGDQFQKLGLNSKAMEVEALGLRFHPPRASINRVEKVGDRLTVVLLDESETPAWSMRIQSIARADANLTPSKQIDRILDRWRAAGRSIEVISNEPAAYAGRVGRLCYIRETIDESTSVVHGWLVLEADQLNTLVFAMQMLPEAYDRMRPIIRSSFATLRVRSVSEISQARQDRLEAGKNFLDSLTPKRLEALLGQRQWFRYYQPAGAAGNSRDVELGWFVIDFAEDKRGAVNPARSESAYSSEEHDLGLLVTVYGHYVDRSSGLEYDSEALYWMAWDQSEEAWSIRTTRRFEGKQQSEAHSGIRLPRSTDHPAGMITVINTGRDGTTRDQFNWRTPDVYLSQPIRWGLEQLLPRDRGVLRLSYYAVDTAGPEVSLSLREDEMTPRPPSSPGWIIRTQTRAGADEVVTVLDAGGDLVRRTWPQGFVSEPISLEALRKIWKDDLPASRK